MAKSLINLSSFCNVFFQKSDLRQRFFERMATF